MAKKINSKNLFSIAEKVVVKIETENSKVNIYTPHETELLGNSFGSGFFIDDQHIVTNHHVIKSAIQIFINIPYIGKNQYSANLIAYSIENDYAILKINNYTNKFDAFKIGNSDKIRQGRHLFVIGFPLGSINPNIKIVKGMITGWERNMIQHDSNVNPGMSGGAVLDTDLNIIGIHVASLRGIDINSTAYAIPINILDVYNRMKLLTKKNINYPYKIESPSFGFSTQISHPALIEAKLSKNNQNNKLLSRLNGSLNKKGVIINKIYKKLDSKMKVGDILLKIDDYVVDNYNDIRYNKNPYNKITYKDLTDYAKIGSSYKIQFYSTSKNKIIEEKHNYQTIEKYVPNTIKKINYINPKIQYENIGGLIVQELTMDHVKDFINSKHASLISKYIKYNDMQSEKSVLFVSHVYPTTSLYKNKIISIGDIIKKVNSHNINTLSDYRQIILQNKNNYIELQTDSNEIDIININNIIKSEPLLSQQFNYPISKLYLKLKENSKLD